jgi:hypothetical protein
MALLLGDLDNLAFAEDNSLAMPVVSLFSPPPWLAGSRLRMISAGMKVHVFRIIECSIFTNPMMSIGAWL